jgi:hypothetical protein
MPEEGFLRRWARMKASPEAVAEAPRTDAPAAPAAPAAPVPPAAAPAVQQSTVPDMPADPVQPVLTIEDAARLTPESDFSAFVSQGVDKDVRRLALKKLFSDPHFNIPDRLDMYMDDYNQPSPVSATMLAALQHARSVLRSPEEIQAELARLAARDVPLDAAAQAAEHELAEAEDGSGQDAAIRDADTEIGPNTDDVATANPDSLVQIQPAPQTPLVALPAEQPVDPIALHSPRAHNAEASP